MSKENDFRRINIQLFAEGAGAGTGGTGAEGATAEGMPATSAKMAVKNPLAGVKYGIQEDAQIADVQTNITDENGNTEQKTDRNAEFEKLIKNDYKDLYDARVQETIQKRLKSTKETVDRYHALTPTLEMLAKKYGVDASDINALNQAIEEDNSYYEEEALEKGITVEQLKLIRKMERENAQLKQQMQEQEARDHANRLYASWLEQAERAKTVYPNFDLQSEMQNPRFVDLLSNHVDVRTAYEVLHKDEIIPAAMQFTAQKVGQQLTNKIIANGARPMENGISSQSSAVVKSDVSQLSKDDRAEIIRRVARGEKIRF
ncbi:MAG: hypothetical protein J6K26_01930 [Lachnospiraceae bacterium]|nr:hypothetical protein [Lachnospiraceae bacterium]